MLKGDRKEISESDETPDSDELAKIITKKVNSSPIRNSSLKHRGSSSKRRLDHTISDSDSEVDTKEIRKPNPAKRKLPSLGNYKNEETKIEQVIASKSSTDDRPLCQFGEKCYRKNPEHLKSFRHDTGELNRVKTKEASPPNSFPENKYGFFVTKVKGIDKKFNHENLAVGVKDLLSSAVGKLKASVQFSYMFDIPWLVEQYPKEFRSCPLLLVHGEQRESKRELEQSGKPYPNIKFCQAKLPILYGTHHTKMMLFLYEEGMKIVIHTANMLPNDWHQKTQGVWVSPLFPKCSLDKPEKASLTNFKLDLLQYLKAYEAPELQIWCKHIMDHDMSTARVFLIGSVPGRHAGNNKSLFGHLKLRKVLAKYGPRQETVDTSWPLVSQFSSIGSLGSTPDEWLRGEWLASLAARRGTLTGHAQTSLKLIFPSVDDVRASLEGYPAGANLPYSYKTAAKQLYLRNFMQWCAERLGRSIASPHIKTYLRLSPDSSQIAWFLVTSANLSKAAWGMTEKKGEQLMIRSYELGVLFLPSFHECDQVFPLSGKNLFPVPYDVSLRKYTEKDSPWIWDIPHIKAPDRHGNMWCPPLK